MHYATRFIVAAKLRLFEREFNSRTDWPARVRQGNVQSLNFSVQRTAAAADERVQTCSRSICDSSIGSVVLNRVLLISEVFPPQTGGSGRWFWEIYRRLPREQIAIAAGEHPQQAEFDSRHDVAVDRIPLCIGDWGLCSRVGRQGYYRALTAVARVIKERGSSELHCGRALPEGLIALFLKARYGIPYLCYAHGEELAFAESSRELRWLTRRALKGARALIANSMNTRHLLISRWGACNSKVKVLHPGTDTKRFVPSGRDEHVRQSLGWQRRTVVLTAGRLQRRKGQDMMIRALPAILPRVPDLLYSIVGDGEDRHYLRRLADELGVADHVEFRGEPNDEGLVRCYQQCDLFALPNRAVGCDIEGFGIVLVEAQACGKPVLAGDSGGTQETMRVGETGLIIDCTRPEPLASAVIELLGDPLRRRSMGFAGRLWAERQFDWGALSNQAQSLFAEAAIKARNHSPVTSDSIGSQ